MTKKRSQRAQLLELAKKIQNACDHGWKDTNSLEEFERLLPNTDIYNLCQSDYPIETVVDMCLGTKNTKKILSKDELLELVKRLMFIGQPFATEAEANLALLLFKNNCKHSGKSDLIYYPDEHFDGRSNPTPEEIVQKAVHGE